ncbi:MAG: biotin--[acetyl-CoA-carboxylase] ligase [Planctomycetota bacterium]|nr:biotin--[acetyl-CoA-carboxylase] ligase [Planctomycetota bacterium]
MRRNTKGAAQGADPAKDKFVLRKNTGQAHGRRRGFLLERLRAGLKPFRLYWFPTVGSTSNQAALLRRDGKLFAPAVVLTGRQTSGRGRGSNTWWSDAAGGGLTVTFALPIQEILAPQELPLIAGLAVREAAVELTGNPQILLKWPNDLLFEGQKLAGLLCERVNSIDLVGVGLNVNVDPANAPIPLQGQVTSLLCIGGKELDMTDTLIAVARHLNHSIRLRMQQPFSTFVRQYQEHDALAGKNVRIQAAGEESPISGRCEGIDSAGRLLVRTRESRGDRSALRKIVAGHVMLEPAGWARGG